MVTYLDNKVVNMNRHKLVETLMNNYNSNSFSDPK